MKCGRNTGLIKTVGEALVLITKRLEDLNYNHENGVKNGA